MAVIPTVFNPYASVNAAGSFNISSDGYVQGMAVQQPAIRFSMAQGILALPETLPMYGGVGIYEQIPSQGGSLPNASLGTQIGRATTLTATSATALTGFSVFGKNYAGVNNPQNPVPLTGTHGQVNFFRLGSGALIPVACSGNLIALASQNILTRVSWDFANQQLEPFSSTTISSGTYNSTTGAVILVTGTAHGLLPGDTFETSGITGATALNGEWTATAGTTGTTLNFMATTGLSGISISNGIVSSGGALNVRVVDVNVGNCMTVSVNAGQYSWNRSGNCALILI